MANTIDWPGASGKTYKYWFASEMKTPIMKQEGGNYMFMTRRPMGGIRCTLVKLEIWITASQIIQNCPVYI